MKKLYSIPLLVLSFSILIIGWSNSIGDGYYNHLTGVIVCKNEQACIHEVAHKYDATHGYISRSDDYKHSVDAYRMMIFEYPSMRDERALEINEYPGLGSILWSNTNPLTTSFWFGGWGGYGEFYADTLAWAISHDKKSTTYVYFQWYYDWQYIDEEMEKLGY